VTDPAALQGALDRSEADGVIHLAALQVPACRADPTAGARVNVVGTLNVFEAVRRRPGRLRTIVYASSAAVAGPRDEYSLPIADDALHRPRTHYGVFKLANEGCARVYWLEHGIPSVGLRPLTVYGVGRELGVTSGPTKAIKAAVLSRAYAIGFRGPTGFHYAEDVAAAFVACARAPLEGSHALNVRGEILEVEDFVRLLGQVVPGSDSLIRVEGAPLPIAHDFDQSGLERIAGSLPRTPVAEGIRRTAHRFRELRERGRLRDEDLES
jgi:nucleoside-diphosphate-sugar epimerase